MAEGWESRSEEDEVLEEYSSECDWKEYATKLQKWWFLRIPDDCLTVGSPEEYRLKLQEYIKFAVFDLPKEISPRENMETRYSISEQKTVKLITEAIITIMSETTIPQMRFNFLNIFIVYVFVRTDSGVVRSPVFPVWTGIGTLPFVDNVGRRYKSWESYLKNNELPKGDFCGPRNGMYHTSESGVLQLHFGKTPAASVGKAVLKGVDVVGTVTGIGAFGVFAAASVITAPMAAPVLVAAGIGAVVSGVYSVGRGVATLVDMGVHGQSVNPVKQRRALNVWVNVATSTVAVGAGPLAGQVGRMAASGQVVGKTTMAVSTALNAVSMGGISLRSCSLLAQLKNLNMDTSVAQGLLKWAEDLAQLLINLVNIKSESRGNIVKIVIDKIKELKPVYQKGQQFINLAKVKDWSSGIPILIDAILEAGCHLADLLIETSKTKKWKTRFFSLKIILQRLKGFVPVYQQGHLIVKHMDRMNTDKLKIIMEINEFVKTTRTQFEKALPDLQEHFNKIISSF